MKRVEAAAAWFFTCLGITLLAVGILVIPAEVFADSGDDCVAQCGDDESCMLTCCQTACSGDPACVVTCMQKALKKCSLISCQDKFSGCTVDCNLKRCSEGGLDPNKAQCASITTGCKCRY